MATKLQDLGDQAGHDEQMAKIRELDPDESSLPMQQRNRERITEAMEARFDDEKGLYETKPLEEWLANGRQALGGALLRLELPGRSQLAPETASSLSRQGLRLGLGARAGGPGLPLRLDAWPRAPGRSAASSPSPSAPWRLKAALRSAREGRDRIAATRERLAACLDALACSYFMNGESKLAIETIERSIGLDEARTRPIGCASRSSRSAR